MDLFQLILGLPGLPLNLLGLLDLPVLALDRDLGLTDLDHLISEQRLPSVRFRQKLVLGQCLEN